MNGLTNLPFDIVIFLLRLAFVFLLYFFVFQVTRALTRDLRQVKPAEMAASPYGRAIVVNPGSTGLAPGTGFNLEPITSIGRKLTNTIPLDDNFISGEHALLTWRDGRWWAEDYRSTNGTLLNGAELDKPTPVLDGDVITVGGVQLKIARPPGA
ncbi:MAG TPA: FHA domain-containing protein [Chloroflexia bacterium]|nr:FHA domain-containing protein [Chloroflexia bacterium]